MTVLALQAVLPAAAIRTLGEPGAVLVAADDLVGLCVPAPDFTTAEGARAAVLAQHDLLVRVALAHDLVPVRPGAVFTDRARVARHLSDGARAHRARLDRIAGCLELSVSARVAAEPAPLPASTPSDGIAYLRARRSPPSAADGNDRSVRFLSDTLAACAPGLSFLPQPATDPTVAAAALLVPRDRLAAVMSALGRAGEAAATGRAAITLHGPWPCYVFTTAEVRDAAS
jgi:hypothetical protein